MTPANALRQLLAAARSLAPAIAPVERVLLLASRHDRLVDVRCSRRLASARQCALAEHPNAGHNLPLDAQEWVVQQVLGWLPG